MSFDLAGGERGIRTLGTLLTHTHFPGVLLQPLGHLSREEKLSIESLAVQLALDKMDPANKSQDVVRVGF